MTAAPIRSTVAIIATAALLALVAMFVFAQGSATAVPGPPGKNTVANWEVVDNNLNRGSLAPGSVSWSELTDSTDDILQRTKCAGANAVPVYYEFSAATPGTATDSWNRTSDDSALPAGTRIEACAVLP